MVARYEAARSDPFLASHLILRSWGISNPTEEDEAAALLEAEFKLKVIHALSGKR